MKVISARVGGKGNIECKNKPIFLVDRAPWYKEVLSRRGFKYERKEKRCRILDSFVHSTVQLKKVFSMVMSLSCQPSTAALST